ncbi:lysine N(6)-hydroxylase/L-ornithine N(5)-oxygenase family protein [Aquimarina sp. W85]|uniref:lysine N(6)-hydroxylase/L-ornithine N(5)-oxygenase family protein n=1 Tax=Aquimarina rhodophyticola TaxID=3342246 RepID=UPI00366E73EE
MTHKIPTLDFIAVGVGPFNLGLACLTEPIKDLNGLFLDKRKSFNWHPGMLMQDTTLQIPFMADLVTMADPTSPYSFLNYIKEQGKMYSFYIKENFLLLRNEYNQYCQWAIQKLSNVLFNTEVLYIEYDAQKKLYCVHTKDTTNGVIAIRYAKKIVLGTGTVPYIPKSCEGAFPNTIHSSTYLQHKETLQQKKSITVVGSGQSAAEIFYDLLQDIDSKKYSLKWITRSPRFFPLEYSKLTLEMTSPEYVDYFYQLPEEKRNELISKQKHLYKGINESLIADIYDLLYAKKLIATVDVELRTHASLEKLGYNSDDTCLDITLHHLEQDEMFQVTTEGLVLATGYHYQAPKFIEGISDRIKWDKHQRYAVHRNYAIDYGGEEIFVQNAELHTHGFVTPDLGMACYRNSSIIKELTGIEHYPIEKRIAFQQFGVTAEEKLAFTDSLVN